MRPNKHTEHQGIMGRTNWTRYASAINEDYWDTDSGTTHAPGRLGRTLCETRIGKHVHEGGNWEEDWHEVTCKRCLQILNRERVSP